MSDLSPAAQQYVRAIYDLQHAYPGDSVEASAAPRVTTSQLAECMGLRAASITAMLQKLAAAEPPLIEYTKHQGARLTRDGRYAALALIRRHRLLEAYLYERLNYRWDEVHDEARRLEPVVTDALAERLAEALGQPTRDPHGHAIPGPDLSLDEIDIFPLTALPEGTPATVAHVSDADPDLLRFLAENGLQPGAVLTVAGHDDERRPIAVRLQSTGQVIDLPARDMDQIYVTTGDDVLADD